MNWFFFSTALYGKYLKIVRVVVTRNLNKKTFVKREKNSRSVKQGGWEWKIIFKICYYVVYTLYFYFIFFFSLFRVFIFPFANTVCVCKTHGRRRRVVDIDWERRDPVMRKKSDLGLPFPGHRRGRGYTRAHVKLFREK